MGATGKCWLTDTAVPIDGQKNDDEPGGGNEGVAKSDIPESEIVHALVTIMAFSHHHDFYEVSNREHQVKQVGQGQSPQEEECWSLKPGSSHDGQVGSRARDAEDQEDWADKPVGDTSVAITQTLLTQDLEYKK